MVCLTLCCRRWYLSPYALPVYLLMIFGSKITRYLQGVKPGEWTAPIHDEYRQAIMPAEDPSWRFYWNWASFSEAGLSSFLPEFGRRLARIFNPFGILVPSSKETTDFAQVMLPDLEDGKRDNRGERHSNWSEFRLPRNRSRSLTHPNCLSVILGPRYLQLYASDSSYSMD